MADHWQAAAAAPPMEVGRWASINGVGWGIGPVALYGANDNYRQAAAAAAA